MNTPEFLWNVAAVATAVGALFLLRFVAAFRRLRTASGSNALEWRRWTEIRQTNAFGSEVEPERRYALRQLGAGGVLFILGLALYAVLAVDRLWVGLG